MSNPNLDTVLHNLNPQDREIENSIRHSDMNSFTGQPQHIEI